MKDKKKVASVVVTSIKLMPSMEWISISQAELCKCLDIKMRERKDGRRRKVIKINFPLVYYWTLVKRGKYDA